MEAPNFQSSVKLASIFSVFFYPNLLDNHKVFKIANKKTVFTVFLNNRINSAEQSFQTSKTVNNKQIPDRWVLNVKGYGTLPKDIITYFYAPNTLRNLVLKET